MAVFLKRTKYATMKNTNYLLLIIFLLLFVGCNKDEDTENNTECLMCNTKAPLTELDWLAEIIEHLEESNSTATISYCTYNNGLEAFYIDYCPNCEGNYWVYYDCEGNLLCGDFGIFSCIDPFNIETKELIWVQSPESTIDN